MKKRVMISSVTASMITGMFLLTGCGGGVTSTPASSATSLVGNTDQTNDRDTSKATSTSKSMKPITASEITKITQTAPVASNCATFEGGTQTANGKIRALDVVAYKADGTVIGTDTSSSDGQVCFVEAPATIKVRSAGLDGERVVQCGSIFNYTHTIDCSDTWGNPTDIIRQPEVFKNLFSTLYQSMGVGVYDHHEHQAPIEKALKATTMTEILDALLVFKYDADNNKNTPDTAFAAEGWKSDIIKYAVEIYTSRYATEDVQSVAMASIDGLIKMGAYGLADANTPLHNADRDFLKELSSNLDQIQRFFAEFDGDDAGVDRRALAVRLLTGDFLFGANDIIVYKDGLNLGGGVVSANAMKAENGLVSNCIHSENLVCGPRVNVYSIDGVIAKNYGDIKDSEGDYVPYSTVVTSNDPSLNKAQNKMAFYGPLNELSELAVCDAIDNKADYEYGITNIQALCAPSFNKYCLDATDPKVGELPATFSTTQKFLSFTDLALGKSTNAQFAIMADYLHNASVIELSPKIDPSMYGTTQEFLTTITMEMPKTTQECNANSNCAKTAQDELEYLTLTFAAVYTIDADGAWTVAIKGQDALPIDAEDIPADELEAAQAEAAAAGICPDALADPLGCVKCKDTSNLDGEMKITARVNKGNGEYETIVTNWYNETTDMLETRPNGATLIRPLDLMRDYMSNVKASKASTIKEMLVRNLTNVGGSPEAVKTRISMLNNTDVRYISYGEGIAEVTDDAALHTATISMREAEQNAEVIKKEAKDVAKELLAGEIGDAALSAANGYIALYNIDADIVNMLSLGGALLPQLPYLPDDATAAEVADAGADAVTAAGEAATAATQAMTDLVASAAQIATDAATAVAEATANNIAAAANPCATDETRACAAHKLEEALEVYEKAAELSGLGVAQYATACGTGPGIAFHTVSGLLATGAAATSVDSLTDAWVECTTTIYSDYAEIRAALSDAAETDDDIEIIAIHGKNIGEFTTYDVLRTANIFDRIAMLSAKIDMTDDEQKEYNDLVDRANFIQNPNIMTPQGYALHKGTNVGGFDTPNHDFYEPDTYSIDDLYRKIIKSGARLNSVVIETKFDDCADGCGQ